jgi:hypothetical protein
MRLENLYPSFDNASPEEQLEYVTLYRLRRAEDMLKTPTWPKVKKVAKSKAKVPSLTEEEKVLMQLLGLKKKDVITLREMKQ